MGRVNTPQLNNSDRHALETGFKQGESHCFRNRCHVILLKSEGRSSKDTGSITGMSDVSVNSWVKRFKQEGIDGLRNKPGQGRKPLLGETDTSSVLEAVKRNRQRLQTAKAEWETSSGRRISGSTLRRFLKSLADDISE